MKKVELDRVRSNSQKKDNLQIEKSILASMREYSNKSKKEITDQIIKIEKEWAVERWLEMNASLLAFIGVILGGFVHLYWLFLPGIILPFLFLHAIQGWCPPIPILRKLKVRTRREIDWEKFALKFIRGDFDHLSSPIKNKELLDKIKKVN